MAALRTQLDALTSSTGAGRRPTLAYVLLSSLHMRPVSPAVAALEAELSDLAAKSRSLDADRKAASDQLPKLSRRRVKVPQRACASHDEKEHEFTCTRALVPCRRRRESRSCSRALRRTPPPLPSCAWSSPPSRRVIYDPSLHSSPPPCPPSWLQKRIASTEKELSASRPALEDASKAFATLRDELARATQRMDAIYEKQGRGQRFRSRKERDAHLASLSAAVQVG